MTLVKPVGYAAAVIFWMLTAFYALLASQDFIYEQFLQPELLPPLAWFARFWPLIATLGFTLWFLPRGTPWKRPHFSTWVTTIAWAAAVVAAWVGYSAGAVSPGTGARLWALAACAMLVPVAVAERPDARAREGQARPRTAADFVACLLAALVFVAIDAAIGIFNAAPPTGATAWLIARGPLLAAMTAFLVLTLVRAVAGFFRRVVAVEAAGTVIALGTLIGWFIVRVLMPSISVAGWQAMAAGYFAGLAIALAMTVRGLHTLEYSDDGVRSVFGSLAPRVTARVSGFVVWCVVIAAVAFVLHRATQATDWSGVGARLGVLLVWVLALAGARRVVRMPGDGEPAVFLLLAVLVLGAELGMRRVVAADASASTPAARWTHDLLTIAPADEPSELFDLLSAHTNIPKAHAVAPAQVDWAKLGGPPAADRPDVYVFVVDSLRRDYLSPYNPAVSFTPAIAAFAQDSLVFSHAFTQYGATGLSVPSIWMGGPLLHKQYIEPFAPMNALSRLLAQEQYAQWISMDNILDVILLATPALAPLDAQRPVRDFRLCGTLDEILGRLRERPAGGPPVFAYSLPQDIHVSVITREGGRALDGGAYDGFYAPVASRVRRLDSCFGNFIAALKESGAYDRSVIVVTSDHGDSLGEEGRMGHAYTLYPEIVRVPLIVHVPPALRDRYSWDVQRPAYTTDLAPTLFQLLGHEPMPPQPFFGESLAGVAGVTRPAPRDRMIAASYGSVYGALMAGATRLYVVDAIQRREMAFEIGQGPAAGTAVAVTPTLRRDGGAVIRSTVEGLARQYQFTPAPR
jgi:glucan phosphoethanolaminetransferase (alkaline phosphatase superfamily)